jgi:NIPSNAP
MTLNGRKFKGLTTCGIAMVCFAAGSLMVARLKHDLNVVGYWVPGDSPAWDNTFIFILAHPSREEAKKNWDAMRADPAFQEMMKSEQADKLVEKVDSADMHATDFSPMK